MKKFLVVFLALIMIVAVFAGCGKTPENSSKASENSQQEQTSEAGSKYPSGYAFDETSYKGKTLRWWNHWDTVDTKGYIAEFENATGAKIEYSTLSGNGGTEYAAQLSSAITAGTGPDIAVVYDWALPAWTRKGLLIPLSEVLDVNEEIYKDKISQAMLDFFTYQHESYVINTSNVACYYLLYRKDLIDEAGLDDPYELWEKGEWNYEKFNEYMQALTYDSDDDGVIDMRGLTGYTDEAWLGTVENGNYVRWKEDGTPYFALTDSDMLECLVENRECMYNGWQKQDVLPVDEFKSGKFAFFYSAQWDWQVVIEAFGAENIGWVQMPYAMGNTSKVVLNRTNAVGYAFPSCIKEKGLAEHYIKYNMFWTRIDVDPEESIAEYVETSFGGIRELYDFHTAMQKQTFAPNAGCFSVLLNVIQSKVLWNFEDTPANQVQSAKTAAQMLIDEVFYGDDE